MGRGLRAAVLMSLGLACPVAGQNGFEHVLPSDGLFFAGCEDVDALRSAILRSQVGALIGDPANAELFDRLGAGLQAIDGRLADLIGAGPLGLASLVHGRLAVAVFGSPGADKGTLHGVALALLADVESQRSSLVDSLADGVGIALGQAASNEIVDGADVRTIRSISTGSGPDLRVRLAMLGETLIVTVELLPMEQDALATLLAGLDRPPADALAGSPHFRDTLAAAPGGGVQVWADLDRLGTLFRRWDERFMLSFDYLKPLLGPLDVGCAALRATFGPAGLRVRLGVDWSLSGPLLAVAEQFRAPASTRLLGHVPLDSAAASISAFDPKGLFDAIPSWLTNTGLATRERVDQVLAQSADLLDAPAEALLGALDGEFGFVMGRAGQEGSLPAELGSSHQLALLLGLKDATVVAGMVEALARSASPSARRPSFQVEGTPCFRVNVDSLTLTGAVLSDLLVVSTSEALLGDLLRAGQARRHDSLADDPHVQERIAALSPGWTSLEYKDSVQQLGDLLAAMAEMRSHLGPPADQMLGDWLGPLLDLPPLDVAAARRHLASGQVTGSSVNGAGMRTETLLY